MAKRYGAERKWRDEHYVPAKIEEHLQISVGSSACMHIVNITFILMGDITTRVAIEWALSYPEMIRAVCIVGRISNDIMSHEVCTPSISHFLSATSAYSVLLRCTLHGTSHELKILLQLKQLKVVVTIYFLITTLIFCP